MWLFLLITALSFPISWGSMKTEDGQCEPLDNSWADLAFKKGNVEVTEFVTARGGGGGGMFLPDNFEFSCFLLQSKAI